jgi:hypothetical protein
MFETTNQPRLWVFMTFRNCLTKKAHEEVTGAAAPVHSPQSATSGGPGGGMARKSCAP